MAESEGIRGIIYWGVVLWRKSLLICIPGFRYNHQNEDILQDTVPNKE